MRRHSFPLLPLRNTITPSSEQISYFEVQTVSSFETSLDCRWV